MSLLSILGMSPEKAISMILSGNQEKKEKARAWMIENADAAYPALLRKFSAEAGKGAGKKGQPSAPDELYSFICGLPLPPEMIVTFADIVLKRPENIELDAAKMPPAFYDEGYQAILSALHDDRPFVRERAMRLLEKMKLPEQILSDLIPMIVPGNGQAGDAMKLLGNVEGDLLPAREALYRMLDVYPDGDEALQVIVSLKDRLPCDSNALRIFLNDDRSRAQKRVVPIALAYAGTDEAADDILRSAVARSESVRAFLIDTAEKKKNLTEREMDLTWEALTHAASDFTVSRAIKILTAQGDAALPLFLHHIRNGDAAGIVCALRCLTAMKSDTEPADRSVAAGLADESSPIFSKIDIRDYPYLGAYLRQKCTGFEEKPIVAAKARDRCAAAGAAVPPEILCSLTESDLAETIDQTLSHIFSVYGRGYDDAFADKFLTGLENVLQIDKAILSLAIRAAGYVFSYDGYTDEIRIIGSDANAAVNRLRSINTPVTSNILHLISKKKDIRIALCPESGQPETAAGAAVKTLSFDAQRQNANAELERRGFPSYNARNYLTGH